ncbi:MAG: DUF3137 domain-containing protein [Alphaproteobacteria bacterium]|nr:DUF3137 domain-containing protein [Alphaproteobacteria bacterium]
MRDLEAIREELTPWLEDKEAERKQAVRRFLISIPIALGLAATAGVVGALFAWPAPVIVILAVIMAGLTLALGASAMNALRRTVKLQLNTRMAEAFGLAYREKPPTPSRFEAFKGHGLVPGGDRRSFEDNFHGALHGAEFELYEAHVEERRRTKNRTYYVTVFRGALIRIRFPRTVEGVTLVTRDKGIFNAFEGWGKKTFGSHGKKLDRIGLVDPTFEKQFEVYGTDQVMARYLLTPSFMERLLELETLLKGKNVRCVFDESLGEEAGQGELLIAAETGNLFEPATLFTPLTDPKRVDDLYADIKTIERIAGTLLESPVERMEQGA